MVNQLKDNLKQLEGLAKRSSSGVAQRKELFKEIAAKAQQPVEIVQKKAILTNTFIIYLLSEFERQQNELLEDNDELNLAEFIVPQLKEYLYLYQGLEAITPHEFALLDADFVSQLEQTIARINHFLETEICPKFTQPKFFLTIGSFFNRNLKDLLEYSKLIKRIVKKGKKLEKIIANREEINLKDYPWHELDSTDLKTSNQFFLLAFFKNLSKTEQEDFLLQIKEDKAEYLEELGIQPTTSIEKTIVKNSKVYQEEREDRKNQPPHINDRHTISQQNNWDREEQIRKNQKLMDHFRKKLTERSPKTSEEIEQGKIAFEFLQEVIRNSR